MEEKEVEGREGEGHEKKRPYRKLFASLSQTHSQLYLLKQEKGLVMPSRPTSVLVPRSLSLLYVCMSDKTSPAHICPLNFPFYTVVTLSGTEVTLLAKTTQNHNCRATIAINPIVVETFHLKAQM